MTTQDKPSALAVAQQISEELADEGIYLPAGGIDVLATALAPLVGALERLHAAVEATDDVNPPAVATLDELDTAQEQARAALRRVQE